MDLLDRIAPTTSVPAPAGMVAVTQDQFFAYVGPRDIVTSLNDPTFTVWETRCREPVGRTYPGWKNPGGEEAHFLTQAAAAALK